MGGCSSSVDDQAPTSRDQESHTIHHSYDQTHQADVLNSRTIKVQQPGSNAKKVANEASKSGTTRRDEQAQERYASANLPGGKHNRQTGLSSFFQQSPWENSFHEERNSSVMRQSHVEGTCRESQNASVLHKSQMEDSHKKRTNTSVLNQSQVRDLYSKRQNPSVPHQTQAEDTKSDRQNPSVLHQTQAENTNSERQNLSVLHQSQVKGQHSSVVESYGVVTGARRTQNHEHRNSQLQVSYKNENPETADMKIQIQELRNERNDMWNYNKDLTRNNADLQTKLKQRDDEIDNLKTRLSRVASERLTDNNPNIADLSDPNRATKLADMYKEIYANEWTDAFEELRASGERTEQETISILLDLIKSIFNMCHDISKKHIEDLNTNILLFTCHVFRGRTMQLPSHLSGALKPFKDERKRMYKEFLSTLNMEINQVDLCDLKLTEKDRQKKSLQKYLKSVTEICWLMCIQDPPVYLYTDCNHGDQFDETTFAAFTQRGTNVDFLVWPCLQLHKNGPVLQKGVAQGKTGKKQKKAKTFKSQTTRDYSSAQNDMEDTKKAFNSVQSF